MKAQRSLIFIITAFPALLNAQDTIQRKKALIFGVTGQDGSYLAELLLDKDYEVFGVQRRSSSHNTKRIDHILENKRFSLHYGDVADSTNVMRLIGEIKPDEIYNLAAQSHVRISFDEPLYTASVDALGTMNVLEAIKNLGLIEKTRFYQASTSELYGKVQEIPQKETTPFYPRSPYGVAKIYGFWATVNYRESYGMYACNGILFNHESPRRGVDFVTRKITRAVARHSCGDKNVLSLGNLDASRDWGFAGDYVEAMWLMLQQDHAEDFVIATGKTHTVRDFVERAYAEISINIQWLGSGVDEIGIDKNTGETLVKIDPYYFRPAEVDLLIGDPAKATEKLNWTAKTDLTALVSMMVKDDIEELCQN